MVNLYVKTFKLNFFKHLCSIKIVSLLSTQPNFLSGVKKRNFHYHPYPVFPLSNDRLNLNLFHPSNIPMKGSNEQNYSDQYCTEV